MLPNGFTKLDRTILESTVWAGQPMDVKVVWVTLLALMNAEGYVWAALPGIAAHAGTTVERCEEILQQFQQPDIHSRTKDNEGRRLEVVDRGWRVLNAPAYRNAQTPEQAKHAARMRRWRDGKTE